MRSLFDVIVPPESTVANLGELPDPCGTCGYQWGILLGILLLLVLAAVLIVLKVKKGPNKPVSPEGTAAEEVEGKNEE